MKPVLLIVLAACFTTNVSSQIQSPILQPDGKVTFNIKAPGANIVTLAGWDLMSFLRQTQSGSTPFAGMPMTKNNDGVFTITVGPLPPNTYQYNFNVDGVRVVDPANVNIVAGSQAPNSAFTIKGNDGDYLTSRNVPHGTVHKELYYSSVSNSNRELYIYTPPGYDLKKKYPVLYLLHGAGELAHSWSSIGFANIIADNLLADKKMLPCIIVMPNGHVVERVIGRPPAPNNNTKLFEDDFINNIIPFVESKYSCSSKKNERAIAGLSMGGMQTSVIGFKHLDLFDYIGVFSAGLPAFAKDNSSLISQPQLLNKQLKLFFLGVGALDKVGINPTTGHKGAFGELEILHKTLKASSINHSYVVLPDTDHTWFAWRPLLAEHFLPALWR